MSKIYKYAKFLEGQIGTKYKATLTCASLKLAKVASLLSYLKDGVVSRVSQM